MCSEGEAPKVIRYKMVKPYFKNKPIRLKGAALKYVKLSVLSRDNGVCQCPYCEGGAPLDSPHHIKFKGRGGDDSEENLITVCVVCHRKIHDEKINVTGEFPDLEWRFKK